MILSSLLQAAVVSSVPVFFSVVLNGEPAFDLFELPLSLKGTENTLKLSFVLFSLVVFSSGMSVFTLYMGRRLTIKRVPAISTKLLKKYLQQPYEWHLQQNSSKLIKQVLSDVNAVFSGVMSQLIQVFAKAFDLIVLFAVLVIAKPVVAISAFAGLSLVYLILFGLGKAHIEAAGKRVFHASSIRFVSAREALENTKLLKIYQCESRFLERFESAAEDVAKEQMTMAYFGLIPKPLLEVCLFGGIFLGVAALTARGWSAEATVPLLSLYGAAGIRVLPAAQQIYYSFHSLLSNSYLLGKLADDLRDTNTEEVLRRMDECVEACDKIRFSGVSFHYEGGSQAALEGVSFEALAGSKIAFVGQTGSGKSTLVNLLLCLLQPTKGSIGLPFLKESRISNVVGYVPQDVSFTDATIASNIAFGIPEDEIDYEKVRDAAKKAQAWDFIAELPGGVQYSLGEDATRLSGGQRQRIGIARALYFSPSVLVLDEASSALDADTERNVFEELFKLDDLTLVVIGHRLSVLKECDRLFLLKQGRLVAEGSFEELLEISEYFRSLLDGDFAAGRREN